MKLAYQTNTWGGVVGHPAGVTSIKDLYYLTNGPLEPALREISEAGYEGFELFDGNLMPFADNQDAFRDLLRNYSLEFVAVYSGANFIYPDVLQEELWRIRTSAEVAAALGARYLVVGGGAIRSSGIRDEDFRALASGLDRVAEMARGLGMEPCYHPHLGTMAQAPDQVDKVLQLTSIPLCPDTAHLVAGGADMQQIIRKYGSRINYVHLKDLSSDFSTNPFAFQPLGKGALDMGGIVSALKQMGYDGWITVELDAYEGPPKEAAEISRAYLQSAFGRQINQRAA